MEPRRRRSARSRVRRALQCGKMRIKRPIQSREANSPDPPATPRTRDNRSREDSSPPPQNPLGSRMSDGNRRLLAKLVARYEIPLIENDRVAELYCNDLRPRPVKAFDGAGQVLHCGSLATWLAPAYKIGWIAAGKYRAEIAKTKDSVVALYILRVSGRDGGVSRAWAGGAESSPSASIPDRTL
jgi:hypothetical protein